MSRLEKTIQKMRESPRDWKIETLESIARRMGILIRKSGGSHVVFFHEQSELVITVPAKRPVKPVYIYQFLSLLDDIGV